jgi:hypothetical protein
VPAAREGSGYGSRPKLWYGLLLKDVDDPRDLLKPLLAPFLRRLPPVPSFVLLRGGANGAGLHGWKGVKKGDVKAFHIHSREPVFTFLGCRAQNDRPLVSRLTNIGMAGGLLRLPESDCFGPQSQASRYGDRKSRGGDPLLGRPGARAPISGISDPRFVRLAEFRLLGLSVPVIASSKL